MEFEILCYSYVKFHTRIDRYDEKIQEVIKDGLGRPLKVGNIPELVEKIVVRILIAIINGHLPVPQAGFRSVRSTTDMLFALR